MCFNSDLNCRIFRISHKNDDNISPEFILKHVIQSGDECMIAVIAMQKQRKELIVRMNKNN